MMAISKVTVTFKYRQVMCIQDVSRCRAAAVELTSDDLRQIEEVASRLTVQEARYPEHMERMTNR